MKKSFVAAVSFAALAYGVSASADEHLVRFEGGIGVIPVSNAAVSGTPPTVTVTRNIVRGVNPPGQIWVIAGLRADIRTDGRILVDGRGLLLGGGNGVGGNGNQSVRATLICDTVIPEGATTPPLFNSGLVPLEPNGDFRIDDVLTPAPPAECPSPVLLIRNPGGAWFAAGIPKL